MISKITAEEIAENIRSNNVQGLKNLKEKLNRVNPVDIAQVLDELTDEQRLIAFRLLSKDNAADTFVEMEQDSQQKLIEGFTDNELKQVLADVYADDMADMLEEMPANVVERVLSKTDPQMRADVNQLLQYPEDSAGAVMTTEYVALKEATKVSDAFDWIRKNGDDRKDLYTCYVTDPQKKLIGVVTVRDMLLCKKDVPVSDIMEKDIISVRTLDDKEDAAKLFDRYDLSALPVIDNEQRLVGIITADDAIDVLQDENTEDFQKMAAIVPQEDTYFETSVWQHAKNRLPWLLILMFSSIFTGMIIDKYEAAFTTMPVLVALMPMLSDTGGNCGSQTSTLVIRGMAVDEIKLKDFFRVFWKEFRIAIIVGACLAAANGVRILIQYHNPVLAMIIASTLVFVVIASKLMGCCLPMLAKALHMDPAIMASPLLTTVVDVCSVWIYFSIATALMK
ncbi:MAG: magnesium transporter [Firmicutes bacterium]|nr:magnesium transporter [Bacillota bacterium]